MKPSVVSVLSDELLSMVDYFIPNEKEINLLCPDLTNHYEQCEYLLKKGVKSVILTLGERGCYLHAPDHTRLFPASEHAAADTTGGSDAFISALAVYLSETWNWSRPFRPRSTPPDSASRGRASSRR